MTSIETKHQEEEVKGLDDTVVEQPIYLAHQSSPTDVYAVAYSAAKLSDKLKVALIDNTPDDTYGTSPDNPLLLDSSVNPKTIKFVVDYMNQFAEVDEPDAPEKPLKNIDMSVVFGDEYKLFSTIYDPKSNPKEQIAYIYEHITIANNLGMVTLVHKLCALIGSFIKGKPLDEIKTIIGTDGIDSEEKSDESKMDVSE
jgi:hypothetical protein